MAAKQSRLSGLNRSQVHRQQVLEALEKGELVRLLAETDAGKLDPRELQAVLDQYERKHWVSRLFAALLGKRV